MATIDVLNLSGDKVGKFDLADEIFGAVNEDLLWEAVKQYRAAQRAGTHATKNRKLVSGSGKKLWRQKGTGRARVGSIRAPTSTTWPARSCWARCAQRWRPRWQMANSRWWKASSRRNPRPKN